METTNPIVNKITESGIMTLDLEDYYPKNEVLIFDLKDYLFMGLVLKEKDFRGALASLNFGLYQNKLVVITCTADAIIPMWANMLVAATLHPFAQTVVFGTQEQLIESILLQNLQTIDASTYLNQRVIIKGCGGVKIPASAYVFITNKLLAFAKVIMYGEPCGAVPIYKKK